MKILVVDDHALIREALRGVLKELKEDASVIEAPDWRQATRQVELSPDFDLILLDLNLPDRDGFDALAELRERYPAISIVVLSARDDRDSVTKAFDLGALGFIPKAARRDVMLNAFKLIFSGGHTSRRRFLSATVRPRRSRRRHLREQDDESRPPISA